MPKCSYVARDGRSIWWKGVAILYHHNLLNGPGIHWVHAPKGGGAVLVGQTSWRNINGILIRTRKHQLFLHFRRLPWYLVPKRVGS